MMMPAMVAITEALDLGRKQSVSGTIVDVRAGAPAERALVGSKVSFVYSGTKVPHVTYRVGMLLWVDVPIELVNLALDKVALNEQAIIDFEAKSIRSINEPCPRVPLSLLLELRGQEAGTERTRQALVSVWRDDRKTGKRQVGG